MFALANTLAAAGFVPARLEAEMLAACRAAGASAWYVKDDFAGAYQDSTGSTAISAIGQPVGRINDSSAATNVTQATAGNRPLVSRIPRKLGPEKSQAANYVVATGGYDNTLSGVSASGFTAAPGTTQSRVALNLQTDIGKTYSATFRVVSGVASGSLVVYSRDSANGGGATINSVSNLTAGVTYSLQFVATSIVSSLLWVSPIAAQGFAIDNISVREVLEWSNTLTFDGSNDSLAAPASVIGATLTQPYTMISWGKVGAIGASRGMQGDLSRWIGISSAGRAAVVHNGTISRQGTTPLQQGQMIVLEATYDGAAISLWVNGAKEVDQVASGAPTTVVSTHAVGQSGGSAAYFNDQIGGCVVCPAVMSDAQRLAVRRFAAAQMGLTL